MSQFGMQMPGGRRKAAPSLNIYTGLLFLAVAALAAATAFMYQAATKVGKSGTPWEIQDPKSLTISDSR
jgi:hypothetical protein